MRRHRQPSSHTGMSSVIPGVTIFLFEGKKFPASDQPGDPFCEFQLGTEMYRTNRASATDLDPTNPLWMEEFDLFLHDSHQNRLEITVWESKMAGTKAAVMGKTTVDLTQLQLGKVEEMWLDLEDGNESSGSLRLSFVLGKRSLMMDIASDETLLSRKKCYQEKFHPRNGLKLPEDGCVGVLVVKVIKAAGLPHDHDFNPEKGFFSSVQLVNARMETPLYTEASDPEWNFVFTFPVKDIHTELLVSVSHVTNESAKPDFLGGTAIRLTDILDNQPRWYLLKDEEKTEETSRTILLEAELIYNPLTAALRAIDPKEPCFYRKEPSISLKSFSYDVERARNLFAPLADLATTIGLILNWESPIITVLTFIFYVFFVCFFEIWMIPFSLLICLLANKRIKHHGKLFPNLGNQRIDDFGEKNGENRGEPHDSTSIFTKVFVEIPDAALHVQNILRFCVDLYERFNNILEFNETWLSTCLSIGLAVATILAFLLPIRLIFLLYGIHKFTKKLRKPNKIGHNDLVAFLSRARTNAELRICAELGLPSILQFPKTNSQNSTKKNSRNSDFDAMSNSDEDLTLHIKRKDSSSRNMLGVKKMLKF